MENIENILKERKTTLDKVEVPEELRARLSQALHGKRILKRGNNSRGIKVAAVAVCLAVLLVGYNLNTLAFGQEVEINRVYESNDSTLVTITTDESTVLTRVYLMIDENKVELRNTVTENRDKLPDGQIRHTRTLHFPGKGEELTLHIERINFTEFNNITFEVPLN